MAKRDDVVSSILSKLQTLSKQKNPKVWELILVIERMVLTLNATIAYQAERIEMLEGRVESLESGHKGNA